MSDARIKLTSTNRGVQVMLKVIPRASHPGPDGVVEGRLKLRLASAPTDGKANAEAVAVLASILDVPKSRLEMVAGATSRQKTVLVTGLTADEVAKRLASVLEQETKGKEG